MEMGRVSEHAVTRKLNLLLEEINNIKPPKSVPCYLIKRGEFVGFILLNQVRGKPVTTQYFSSSPSLQDCHEKVTHLEEKFANLQHNYADLAAQQKRMQWALTVISALPIEFVDKQQQLAVKAATANYVGDEVSMIGLIVRWELRNLNLDTDNNIKVLEGRTEVGEVASTDSRVDKLVAIAGPGAGVFKGWELYCDSSALNTILSLITKFVPVLVQKENDARRAVEVLNQGLVVRLPARLTVKGARLKVLFVRPMFSVTGEWCLGCGGLGPDWNFRGRMGCREEVKPQLDRHARNTGELLYFLVDRRSSSGMEGSEI
ncbi:hypothetical protein B0T13DRAFT_519440 [Neurospora crassa]|nr:hypothetical protein B0T13DRAFT_519440 [Neurospora crassa]